MCINLEVLEWSKLLRNAPDDAQDVQLFLIFHRILDSTFNCFLQKFKIKDSEQMHKVHLKLRHKPCSFLFFMSFFFFPVFTKQQSSMYLMKGSN